ncbi:hypothetical protein OWV82_024524, partial [Melia azedarach]
PTHTHTAEQKPINSSFLELLFTSSSSSCPNIFQSAYVIETCSKLLIVGQIWTMAGLGTAGPTLVEAYVMRAQHKEKMKKQRKEEAIDHRKFVGMVADDVNKVPSGCFFWVSKKIHSAKVSSATELDCDKKLEVNENWDCKS